MYTKSIINVYYDTRDYKICVTYYTSAILQYVSGKWSPTLSYRL